MNKILFTLLTIAAFTLNLNMHASSKQKIIEVPPQGEYATIDVKKSSHAVDILLLKPTTRADKKKMAKKVKKNLGEYNPAAIFGLAEFYFDEGDVESYLRYLGLSMLRTSIDIRLVDDPSLSDVKNILFQSDKLKNKVSKQGLSKEKFRKMCIKSIQEALTLDAEPPRNYDQRWVCLRGMNAILNIPIKKTQLQRLTPLSQKKEPNITIRSLASLTAID